MMNSVALRAGAAAAAGVASRALARSSHADAHPFRTLSPTRATQAGSAVDSSHQAEEEAWLEVSLNADGPLFTPAQVGEVVEDVIGLIDNGGGSTDGSEADLAIDTRREGSSSQGRMADIFRASQRLAAHGNVQTAALQAIRNDPQLRHMIEELSNSEIVLADNEPHFPQLEGRDRRRRRGHQSPLKTMLEDIGGLLLRMFHAIGNAVCALARKIRNALASLIKMVNKSIKITTNYVGKLGDEVLVTLPPIVRLATTFTPYGRYAPAVVTGAMLIFILLLTRGR